ncbi:MAG TPA: cytochrome P450 [Acidimicrobiia bacterium]|nr:cytochrome P450 [Acidimicrobiia bacterium]
MRIAQNPEDNGTVTQVLYNPFDPAEIADPYPTYAALHRSSPVLEQPLFNGFVFVRYHDVKAILHDPRFSADRGRSTLLGNLAASGQLPLDPNQNLFGRTLLGLDPPDHTRLRRLVSKAFTPSRIASLEPRVAALTDELLDALGEDPVELMESFAYPLPVLVISELLGLPAADRDRLKSWSDGVALLLDPFPPPAAVARFEESVAGLDGYLRSHFEERRRRPTTDLIGALVAARDGDDALSDDELFSMVVLLLAAGHETTTNLIGNAVVALTRHPEQRPHLDGGKQAVANAVEELLRFDPPVQRTSRVATVPVEVGGVKLHPGDLALLVLAGANRDPAIFPSPDRLDLTRRNARDHLSFGHGIHHCLGAPLARLEGRVGLTALYRRFPHLVADLDQVTWRPSIVLRGPDRLPVDLG